MQLLKGEASFELLLKGGTEYSTFDSRESNMKPDKNIGAVDPHRPVEEGLPLFAETSRDEQARQMGRYAESFKAEKLARSTDTETSKLEAKAVGSLVINHQRLIINALSEELDKDNMGLTSDEIAQATGLTLAQVAIGTPDLESNCIFSGTSWFPTGIIYKTGLTRKIRTGRLATVWRLVGH